MGAGVKPGGVLAMVVLVVLVADGAVVVVVALCELPPQAMRASTAASATRRERRCIRAIVGGASTAGMSAHDVTFGVFIPQGWKMELAGISGAEAKWAKAVEIAVLAEAVGYDSVWVYDHFHNVPTQAH